MREIKFRVWDEVHKEMLYIGLELDNHIGGPQEDLMQYTGLKDVNGKEIYEGDIVHAYTQEDDGWISGEITGVIEYFDNSFCIRCSKTDVINNLWTNAETYKVIGNIYEGSEDNQ